MGFVRMIEKLVASPLCITPHFESLASKMFAVTLTFLLYASLVVLFAELFVFLVLCGPLRFLMPFCESCCR